MDLFKISAHKLLPLKRSAFKLEREIQRLLEANLGGVFGIRFLASEFSTGDKNPGRIDSLGLDENGTPVIIEYKLSSNQAVINQALYYLDWLVDHRGDFELLVQKRLGAGATVDWTAPRVLCVAEDFSHYDTYAVKTIGANIELWKYRVFAGEYLAVELVGGGNAGAGGKAAKKASGGKGAGKGKGGGAAGSSVAYSVDEHLAKAKGEVRAIAEELFEYVSGLGDDVVASPVKLYIAFRTTRNFCCLEMHGKHVFLYLALDPALGGGCDFCRDVRQIGHFGTGDLEVRVERADQVAKAKELAKLAYEKAAG
jgi:predicted transport protein